MHDARLRIIDVNANRAREALRVMEDAARFVLEDADLCREIKEMRHSLHQIIAGLDIDSAALLAWRDTPGDIGTDISTNAEFTRDGIAHVAAAACKRLTEALRSLEECVKSTGGSDLHARPTSTEPTGNRVRDNVQSLVPPARRAAQYVANIRYAAYELERRLLTALPRCTAASDDSPQWCLCVLITESLCEHEEWESVARECMVAGADCLQLREKDLDDAELLRRARVLVRMSHETLLGGGQTQSPDPTNRSTNPRHRRTAIIINDRPDIAVLSGADGVHVGQTDLAIQEVRKLVGRSLIVGVSTGNIEQARQAARDGADYIGVGPMFPTTTKHKPKIAGPTFLREVLADPMTRRLPHLAIGGITPENIGELASAGCRGVAVSSAVQKRQRPAVACQALLDGLASTH